MTHASPVRTLALAVGVSVALHASLFVGDWAGMGELEPEPLAPGYQATLVSEPAAAVTQPLPLLPARAVAFVPKPPALPAMPPLDEAPEISPIPERVEEPEAVAMAEPSAPAEAPPLPVFPADALPGNLTIRYSLSSALAEGEAQYVWRRDGERYEITGTARALGFFAMFLEGSMDQRTTGRVTADGLRPEEFREWRPGAPAEGINFDWEARTLTQSRGGRDQVVPIEGNTVDWLSMVFQLAHQPPREGSLELRVYNQRRLYQYRLDVVGVEEIELPIGRVQALRLRHGPPDAPETVDVWLGIEQHYLPLKLRYPVARNRLVIEQTVRSISFR